MATSAGYREHLEKLIECAVCMDTATDPRRLPCGHSFCFQCLQGLWTSSQPTSRVKCPHCRNEHWLGYHGPSKLPKDFIFEQIREMVAQEPQDEKPGRCDFCPIVFSKTDIFYYCFDCDSISCKDCSVLHKCQKGKACNVKKMDFQYSMICKNHPHPVRFICETCENMLCKKCQRQGTCEDHDLFDIFRGVLLKDDDASRTSATSRPLKGPSSSWFQSRTFGSPSASGLTKTVESPSVSVSSPKTPSTIPTKSKSTSSEAASPEPGPSTSQDQRLSVSGISIDSSTFYVEAMTTSQTVDVIEPVALSPEPSGVTEVTEVTEVSVSDPEPEVPDLPWRNNLDVKARAVTCLPNGHIVVLTETSVLLFTGRGTEVPVSKSKVKLEDARHLVYWKKTDTLVVTERTAKRISILKKDGTRFLRQINVKSKRSSGLFSCASRQSSEIKDLGPYDITMTPDGGFAITTATTTQDNVTHLYDVIIYNHRFKITNRWQCELAPLAIACDEASLLYFPQWHCILVYKTDGTKLYQFGEKRSLFQPLCIQPLPDKRHLVVAHRKSYICDDFAIWQISKWDFDGRRKGHLLEISEVDDGPVVGICVLGNVLAISTENMIKCVDISTLEIS